MNDRTARFDSLQRGEQAVRSFIRRKSMIRKIRGKYIVLSETTGRRFGTYKTLKEAKRRLAQMEYFKRLRGSPRLRRQVRKRRLLK